ncbi:Transcription factor spt20 [Arachnomyces sp. PD_36]|nr:Transcription factor spt20 [Arachnomyces sp. PD_36]
MATAISTKSAPHPPKMKRHPPPFVQSGTNGVRGAQTSQTSSPVPARPGGIKQSATASPAGGIVANGANSRPANRPRKETQKPGEPSARLQRPLGRLNSVDDRRAAKKFPEPYVKTTPYILKKYNKHPPSLTIHLHPTHFRFDQQDGSFPYTSEMKVILEHIKAQTVPHDMLEELMRAGVRFYEGCLIVRVVDHKSVSTQASPSSNSSTDEKNSPFSVHNYNQHVTPSPFVPYPRQNQAKSSPTTATQSASVAPEPASDSTAKGKEVAEEPDSSKGAVQKQPESRPRVFTTVLHQTPLSLQAEITLMSMTPDPRATARRQSQGNAASRTIGSATAAQPAAPLSTTPSTSGADKGPPAKRQKMMVEPHELLEFESKLTRATASPLYLDPVDSLESAQNLLKFLESPLHRDKVPSLKTRKRTVAELAADEALAAEEERFMLIMDERLASAASGGATGSKSAGVEDESGAAPFEPRFLRFKTIENIRQQHKEKAKKEHEKKLQQDQAKRLQQEQEREKRRAAEQRQAEEQQRARDEARRQQAASAQKTQAQLAAQNRQPRPQPNGIVAGAHQPQVSQAQPQSSPIVRNSTPHTSSPHVATAMGTQLSQGAGSPQRPGSALQHAHPGVMAHPMAPTRSQQGPSRNGTPQMNQGTPGMSHVTPIMRNVTPTQRMSHSSPNASTMAQTPVMSQGMIVPQQMNGTMLTPQQHAMMQQRQQQMLAQQNHGGQQLTPQQIAQLQANAHAHQNIQSLQQQQHIMQQQQQQQNQHQQSQQQQPQQQSHPSAQEQAYKAQLLHAQLAQMQTAAHGGARGQQQHQGSPQLNQQQQHTQQQMLAAAQANGGAVQNPGRVAQARYAAIYHQQLNHLRTEMAQKYMNQFGPPAGYPPELRQRYDSLDKVARMRVTEMMRRDQANGQEQRQAAAQAQAQALHQQQQQQQQQHHGMMGNGMGK